MALLADGIINWWHCYQLGHQVVSLILLHSNLWFLKSSVVSVCCLWSPPTLICKSFKSLSSVFWVSSVVLWDLTSKIIQCWIEKLQIQWLPFLCFCVPSLLFILLLFILSGVLVAAILFFLKTGRLCKCRIAMGQDLFHDILPHHYGNSFDFFYVCS